MRCNEARKLIYLQRPGEITDDLRADLQAHMSACRACAEEFRLAERTLRRIGEIRCEEPLLEDPQGLTRAVMRKIEGSRGPAARVLDRPPVRSARAALPEWSIRFALALLVAAFLAETTYDAHRLATLERRIQVQNPAGAGIPVPLQSRVIPTAETVRSLLRGAGLQAAETQTLLEHLRTRYPDLSSITVEDGLDDRERRILDSEGRSFLYELEKLVRTGGQNE